jgi:hypothetical protein
MSIFDIIRSEASEFFKNLKDDFVRPEILLQLPQDDIGDVELFEKIMSYYNVEASYDDFAEFIGNSRVADLEYNPVEYMVLFASKQKGRDDVSNKRVTFLRFCVTNNIAFSEDLFMDYLGWSEDNCVDGELNRWQKMERWLDEGVEVVM